MLSPAKCHRKLFCLSAGTLLFIIYPHADAEAIAISSGKLVTNLTSPAALAPSAVCAGTQIGNFGLASDGVISCSNASVYQYKPFPILNAADTGKVGAGIKKVFPQGYAGQTNLQAGQNFLYNRKISLGKADINTSASSTSPSGSKAAASAFQLTLLGFTIGSAQAKYQRVRFEPLSGLGIGIVNDPVNVMPQSLGTPGSVSIYLGDSTDGAQLPMLQADEPGDYAAETYDFEINGGILFGMTISIDFSTKSLDNAIVFDAFNGPALGYTGSTDQFAEEDFLDNYLLPELNFNPATHTLTQLAPVLLDLLPVEIDGPTEVTYNYTASAGSVAAVPEPASVLLLGAVFAGLAYAGRSRKKA